MTSPSPASAEPITVAGREKGKELCRSLQGTKTIHEAMLAADRLGAFALECLGPYEARVVELEAALATEKAKRQFCPCDVGTGCMYPDKCWRGQKDRAEASEARATALAEAVDRSETIHEANKRLIATLVASEARATAAEAEIEKLKREANTDNINDRLDKLGLRFAVATAGYIKPGKDYTHQINHLRKEFQEAAFDAFCDLALPYRNRATALLEALRQLRSAALAVVADIDDFDHIKTASSEHLVSVSLDLLRGLRVNADTTRAAINAGASNDCK